MKTALIVGDPHLRVQRLEEGQALLSIIEKTIDEKRPDYLIILGDLFHTFAVIRVESLALWAPFFYNVKDKTKVVALVGNHDYAGQGGGDHALVPFKNIIKVIDSPEVVPEVGMCLPFIREKEGFEKLCSSYLGEEQQKQMGLFCHQSFANSQFSNGYYDPHGANLECVKNFGFVVSGHIHKEQEFGNVWHPGTPYQNDWGEAGEDKFIFLTEISGRELKIIEKIETGLPKHHVIEADSLSEVISKIPENPRLIDRYKIVSSGTPAEIAEFKKEPKVQEFAGKVHRLIEAVTSRREGILYSAKNFSGMSNEERLNAYIRSKTWRTDADRVSNAARTVLTRREMVS